jgi:YfiR/HmsC-like
MNHQQSFGSASMSRVVARRLLCVVAIVATILAFPCRSVAAQEAGPTEYQLKAAFLFNFAKFVDWPPSSFAGPQAPFTICIFGNDPFGQAVDSTLKGQSIRGRAVNIRRIQEVTQLRHCQIAFVGASEQHHVHEIVQSLRGASVLLVGESRGFAAEGGAIQFQMEDNRVRFSINPDAAERARLRVSSKLLSLATIVRDSADHEKGGSS